MEYLYNGTRVYNFHHPRQYKRGGFVYPKKNMTRKQLNDDSIHAMLRPGEMVIPVSYKGKPLAKKIIKYLKNNNIYLPKM